MNFKIFSPLILFCMVSLSFGQTATSVKDGNWYNPTTWDCTCIPLPGYNVTIKHNVLLDTSVLYASGSVTIQTGASLYENKAGRAFAVSGGSFTNSGEFGFTFFVSNAGAVTNNSTMYVYAALQNKTYFINNGDILEADSIRNQGTFLNKPESFIQSDSLHNIGYFHNQGEVAAIYFTNSDSLINDNQLDLTYFTNLSYAVNNNTLNVYDFSNLATFNNTYIINSFHDFYNGSVFYNHSQGKFIINHDFLNGDATFHDAVFMNDGLVSVKHNWLNTDSIKGKTGGQYTIQDSSMNTGKMVGSFDFCDKTPPAVSPYIDWNSGYVDPAITYCAFSIPDYLSEKTIRIFPNPSNGKIHFIEDGSVAVMKITDMENREVFSGQFRSLLDVSDLLPGIYIIWFYNKDGQMSGKEKIVVN